MVMDIEGWNPWILAGLLVVIVLLAGAGAVLSVSRQIRQKQRLEAWNEEQKRRQQQEKQQQEEKVRRMKEKFRSAVWVENAADFVFQGETIPDRLEIWKNQLIVQAGKKFQLYPLEQFGVGNELTCEEMYYANMALYEIILEKGHRQYYPRDRYSYCEIIKAY